MKKLAAIFLALAMVVAFVSCNDDNSDVTTTANTIQTNIAPTTEGSSTSSMAEQSTSGSTTTPQVSGVTYVLTTSPDKTVPYVSTTRFEVANFSTAPTTTTPSGINSVTTFPGDITPPSVNVSELPTQPTTAVPTGTTAPTTTAPTTTKSTTTANKTTKATTAKNKTPTALSVNDTSYNSNTSEITLAVSLDGWMSNFATNSQNISIVVDGEKLATTVPCSVSSKVNADGCQLIVIDLSSQSLNTGSTVTFTIPAGLVVTKAGTQYNTSYTGYIVL